MPQTRLGVEEKLSEAVCDECVAVAFKSLDHMRVMTENDVCTGVSNSVAKGDIFWMRVIHINCTKVQRTNENVNVRAQRKNVIFYEPEVERGGSRACGSGVAI